MSVRTMSEEERKEYYRNAKRSQRHREKQHKEREEQESNPTLAQLLRKNNPKAKESDEELVNEWLAVQRPQMERMYFERCIRVHRAIATKLGIADVQPGETLYSFTKRVIDAANADAPEEAPIVWDIQIPDRPICVEAN